MTARKSAKVAAPSSLIGDNLMVLDNVRVAAICNVFNGDQDALAAAKHAMETLSGKRLPNLVAACAGLAPVTVARWDAVKDEAWKAFDASPRFAKRDAKGISLSARSQFSEVKVCVMALTAGFAPTAGVSFQQFVSSARAYCTKVGLIAAPSASAQANAAAKKSTKGDVATPDKARASAARVMAKGDAAFADKLAMVAGEYRPEFEAWFAKLVAAKAALAALDA